jgi:hypothetical protein
VGCSNRIASSTCSQNELRSVGSGNRSFAKGVICERMVFLSLAGRYVASDTRSQTGVCGTRGGGGNGASWAVYARRASSLAAALFAALLSRSSIAWIIASFCSYTSV